MKPMPEFLYHWSPKGNRKSIMEKGLVGSHYGGWCIYLAENPESWRHERFDCWQVSTKNLNCEDFTRVDEGLDEVLYWGRLDKKIAISKMELKLLKGNFN